MQAKVSLCEVTEKTVHQICDLSDTLSEQQQKMVAPNARSIAQAHFSDKAWFRAVYAGEAPVGFIMLHDRLGEGRVLFVAVDDRRPASREGVWTEGGRVTGGVCEGAT